MYPRPLNGLLRLHVALLVALALMAGASLLGARVERNLGISSKDHSTLLVILWVHSAAILLLAMRTARSAARHEQLQRRTLEAEVEERQGLIKQLHRRTRADHVVSRMLRIASESRPLGELWVLILDDLLELPGIARPGRVCVHLLGEPAGAAIDPAYRAPLRRIATQGFPPNDLAQDAPAPEAFCAQAVREGALVWTPLPLLSASTAPEVVGCALPIRAGHRLLGVLYVDARVEPKTNAPPRDLLLAASDILAGLIERQHANDKLARSQAELDHARALDARATRAKDAFLTRVSHELRTPLTAILGFAELLDDDPDPDPERCEAVRTIVSNGTHLLWLIDELLGVSRLDGEDSTGELAMQRASLTRPTSLRAAAVAASALDTVIEPIEGASLAMPNAPPLAGIHVLLAEDNDVNRLLLERILESAGARIVAVQDGAAAVEAATAARAVGAPFEAILMDMQMPVLSGFEATQQLRAQGHREPIIALTASDLAVDLERCHTCGCDSVATKPIDRAQLFALLRAHLKSQDS